MNIKNFLTGRTQQVVVNGYISGHTEVTSGVPQSSVIPPYFLLCINNLPDNITSTVKLYADNVFLYKLIDSLQDSIALLIYTRQDWVNKWLMVFNPTKCKLIRITNKRNQHYCNYYIQNTLIKANSQVKYLGGTIDEHLTFNDHIKNITNKVCQYCMVSIHQTDISLLEAVQRRSARFVFHEFSYFSSVTSMLQQLGWPMLEQIPKAVMVCI